MTGVVSRRSRGRIGGDVALDGGTRNVDLVGKLAINKKKRDRGRGSLRKHSGRALEPAKKLWRQSVFGIWGMAHLYFVVH